MTPAQIGHLISTVGASLEAAIPEISLFAPNLDQKVLTVATTALDDLRQVAEAFGSAEDKNAAQPLFDRLAHDATEVLDALSALPLPPQVALPFRIAAIVLPGVLMAARLVIAALPQHVAPPAPAPAPAPAPEA